MQTMAMSDWLVLAGVCLLYVVAGLWAISRIFPGGRATTSRDRHQQQKRTQDMNTSMQGHNHGGKNHLLGMLAIGAVVLVVLLGTGRSLQQALPLALFLACPLMMVGMMFMMRGNNGQQQGNNGQQQGNDTNERRDPDAVNEQDSTLSSTQPRETTTLP